MESKRELKYYDAHGAMLFTVVTVCVYGLSIVAFIAGHINRRENVKEDENQIMKYLKYTESEKIRREKLKQDVLRLRSQLLANSMLSHYGASEKSRRQTRCDRAHLFLDQSTSGFATQNSETDNNDATSLLMASTENTDHNGTRCDRQISVLSEQIPFVDSDSFVDDSMLENIVRPCESWVTDQEMLDEVGMTAELENEHNDIFIV